MSTNIEKLDDIRTIIITYIAPVSVEEDGGIALKSSADYKREVGTPICRILDFSQAKLNFSDMMIGMTFEKGHEGGTYDPDVFNLFIGSDDLVKLGVESLAQQDHYKGANVKGLFTSRDDAIAAARDLQK